MTTDDSIATIYRRMGLLLAALLLSGVLTGCAANPVTPIQTAKFVDIERFMGDWYVIASIPTFIEKDAYNAVENYRLKEPGVIATTFTFNKGALDGKQKTYHPTGYVYDTESNAVWGMQFVWPFKGDFKIVHVDPNYQHTIIGRSKRDYVWIMARRPDLPEKDYASLVKIVKEQGYATNKLRRVPHNAL